MVGVSVLKQLYVPDNSITAHLLKDLLQQEGIDCQLNGEYLQGGIGELPPLGIVRILVDEENWPAANKVIRAWEAGEYSIPE